MKRFQELKVWRKGHELVLAIYCVTRAFPPEERFGLTSQLRRSAASIPANLAEGCGRQGDGDLVRFCNIAMGSATELEYHLLLAHDLSLIDANQYESLNGRTLEVQRMLAGLIQTLKSRA